MTGIYRHHKGGVYAVLSICTNTTNGQGDAKMVFYCSLTTHQLFVREISQFHEDVKWPDGKMRARFMPLEPPK